MLVKMVQRKVPNKLDDTTQTQPHDHKLNKMMKKSGPVNELPLKNKSLHDSIPPNYMKSTSSFDARKQASPKKTLKTREPASGSSLKLTKTPSFKPLRPSNKVILCEHLEARKATCSSTLKESKFPDYLQLSPGGSELEGTSAMKVCPYTYCSLNGHHHAPLPPLKCYMSAGRRALKTHKSFKLPRETRPPVNKNEEIVEEDMVETPITPKIEERDEIPSKDDQDGSQDLECFDIDWEEGYCSASSKDDEQTFKLHQIDDGQELYDEESVSWTEEDSDSSNQDFDTHMSPITSEEADVNDKTGNLEFSQQKTYQESKTVPDFTDTHHTTIIYNIINFNISIFFNGEKTENGKSVAVQVPATPNTGEVNEAMEEEGMSNKAATEMNQIVADDQDIIDEEPASRSEEGKTPEMDIKKTTTASFCIKSTPNEEACRRGKKLDQDMNYDDSQEFNPRGPNFLPQVADPNAETVDLKHQNIDERKNAEEWMVDYALRQAVNTIAPKRKVSLLVEAFEKVMPIPKYEPPRNRNTSKAFTNARQMQACN